MSLTKLSHSDDSQSDTGKTSFWDWIIFFFENLVFGSRKVLLVNECCLEGASFANFYLKWEINKKIFKWTNKWTNKEREQRLSLGLSMF